MQSHQVPRQLAAILMADIAGFSRLTQQDEDETYVNVRKSLKAFSKIIENKGGEVIGYQGDSVFAVFNSARDALFCAIEAQQHFHRENESVPDHKKIQFRVGLNLGDVIQENNHVFGDDVNITSRIESLAPVGGISISGSFYDAISSKVSYEFLFRGEQHVKNISSPVRVYDVVNEKLSVTTAQKAKTNKPGSVNWLPSILITLVVIITAAGIYHFLSSIDQTRTSESTTVTPSENYSERKPSIAVLPFSNLSNDAEQVYFSDGISEDLITDLSKVSGLFVIARASSFRYREKELDIQAIGKELNINYLVTGSVRKLGSVIRIGAQLLEISSGKQVWGDRYDGHIDDIFTLQDEVLKKIVGALEVKLTDREKENLTERFTNSVAAYDFFLKAKSQFDRVSSVGNKASKVFFEQAIEADPNFADAYAYLSWSYGRDYFFEWVSDPEVALKSADDLIQKAMKRNSRSNVVNMIYGIIKLYQGQHAEAVSAVEKAISLNPNHADSYAMLAFILNYSGMPEKSLEVIRTAMNLNPLHSSLYLNILGQSQFLTSRYEEAVKTFSKAILRNPEDNQIRLWLAASYSLMGNIEEAEWQVLETLSQRPEYSIKDLSERVPFKNPDHLDLLSIGLKRAGLPE